MLRLAMVFFVVALIAAVLGFGGVAVLSWQGATILFVVFLILGVLSFLGHGPRRQSFSRLRETRFPAHRLEKWDRTRTSVRPDIPASGSGGPTHPQRPRTVQPYLEQPWEVASEYRRT
jgi:uncharacterized membrane protein YtjA (UPF0391 family)